jgi:hypothetical protein
MILGYVFWIAIAIILLAFFCEYLDSTLGMGYGTTLTPVLLLFGFSPLQIVPAVLISELITGFMAGFFHHKEGNVNFKPETTDFSLIMNQLHALGYVESFKRGIPTHLKVALLLALCSVVGTVFAVVTAISISKFWLTLYIGCLVLAMGIIILICRNKTYKFSWKKIISLGLIASFNKGMSGGGYGPLVTGGQILAGLEGKNAIGITSLAEGITCLVGVIVYFFASSKPIDWRLASLIVLGAVCSVPFTAKTVKKINTKKLNLFIGILTTILGVVTLFKIFK